MAAVAFEKIVGDHDFRPEARVQNVRGGRSSRQGYIGSGAPISMFAQKSVQEDELPGTATLEEFSVCLVSMYPDVWAAFEDFDVNSNGQIVLGEFVTGLQHMGFSGKDAKKLFRDFKGSLVGAVTKRDWTALWRMGGGNVIPQAARSVSPVGGRSATPPPVVLSFGPFLEGDSTADLFNKHDLEDPVLLFARWAIGKWDILFSLFGYEDVKGVMTGRHKVRASEFVNFVRGQGFEGNAVRVFAEIQREGPHIDRSKSAKVAAGLAAGVDDDEIDDMEERDDITMAQLQHFQGRATGLLANLKVGDEGSPANRLVKLLKEKRGCILRAWRQDLDVRGSGRVAYADFVLACRQLGIPSEARQIWRCFRRDGDSTPLEMADLDAEEAANLDKFAECLWSNFGFDLDQAWSVIDSCSRKMVTPEEWLQGAQRIGFEGNAKIIFQGLGGAGRLWRKDFEYLNVLSRSAMRTQHSAPSIRALGAWVQGQFGSSDKIAGAENFLETIGFPAPSSQPKARNRGGQFTPKDQKREDEMKLTVSDLAARLTALGYPGDALQTAMIAARTGGGTDITRESLYALIAGKRAGAPPRKASLLNRSASAGQLEKKKTQPPSSAQMWRPRKVWKDSVDNFSLGNDKKPACVRNYFSVPEKSSGFSILDAHGPRAPEHKPASPPSSPQAQSRSVSPKVDTNLSNTANFNSTGSASTRAASSSPPRAQRLNSSDSRTTPRRNRASISETIRNRPAWDNSLLYSSEVNNRKSAYVRDYFGPKDQPVKEDLDRRRQVRKNMLAHAQAGMPIQSSVTPSSVRQASPNRIQAQAQSNQFGMPMQSPATPGNARSVSPSGMHPGSQAAMALMAQQPQQMSAPPPTTQPRPPSATTAWRSGGAAANLPTW